MSKHFALSEIAEQLGAELRSDSNAVISSIGSLDSATAGQVSFLSDEKFVDQLKQTNASAVLLKAEHQHLSAVPVLVVSNPYVSYAKLAKILDTTPASAQQIAPSAVIDPTAIVADNVQIGANAVIESGTVLGAGVQVGAGCFIGKDTVIGKNTKLWANVTIYHDVVIGEDCLVQSGAVIGSDGFGYANEAGEWLKIPQTGGVVIGNNVEIGASTTIDRGAIADTEIGNGVIIDNLCHIAHNVKIGNHVAMAAMTGFAGSAIIGDYCTFAGRVSVNGHIELVANSHILACSVVTKSIKTPGVYSSGMPAEDVKSWRKNIANLRGISNLKARLKALENKFKS